LVDVLKVLLELLEMSNSQPLERGQEKHTDRMLAWFRYEHLKPEMQEVSKPFCDLADSLVQNLNAGPERTVALRKLLEAKDAAVRAKVVPGG
jgi:hypothetical protein